MTELTRQLRQICGETHVLTGQDLHAYERDWRGRAQGKALCVVRPSSTAQVAAVVQACEQAGVPMVPQGGNTSLVMGSTPDDSGREVVLSMQRMNAVRSLDKANATITVEAGCVLQQLQQVVHQAGLLFPLSLASEGSCTIGGNLASNAGGTQVLRYGNARNLCLGLEVVTPQGEIWHGLSGLRKDNTGLDLRNLFIGSEGVLGVITAATLQLFPQPTAQGTAWAAVPSVQAAVDLLGMAQRELGAGLTGFEMMMQTALGLVAKHMPALHIPFWQHTPCCVLLELSDTQSQAHAQQQLEHLLDHAMQTACVTDAVVSQSLSQSHQLWHVRESISMAQAAEGLNIKHDIALPVSAIPAFVAQTDALLAQQFPGVRMVNFGHLGDGNLHYNVQCPEHTDAAEFLRIHEARVNHVVFESVRAFNGSISAEHGIGRLKVGTLPQYKDPVALALMRRIKQAIDPKNLMNPGRMLAR